MNCQVDSPTRVSPSLKSITIAYYKQSSVGDLTCLQNKQENIKIGKKWAGEGRILKAPGCSRGGELY